MKLVKKINNNFALAFDDNGEQLIVEGKGIGFIKMPCILKDYKQITRTYYDFDSQNIQMIKEIDESIFRVVNKIVEYAYEILSASLNPNLPFVLADHINFAIKRKKENINISFTIYYDLMQLYPKEAKISEYALRKIKEELNIVLEEQEKSGIIMNLINAELDGSSTKEIKKDVWILKLTSIIENSMHIRIEKNSFNYSRFVTHINYLYSRLKEDKQSLSSNNKEMYETLVLKYPKVNNCVEDFENYLRVQERIELSDEEKLYLILHINRLCNRSIGL